MAQVERETEITYPDGRVEKAVFVRSETHDKRMARQRVNRALASGELVRPTVCEWCGKEAATIDAHHADYSKPLDVEWVCRSCHIKHHIGK